MKTNFHTHTYRCLHATGTEKDYVEEAINRDLDVLGFSDHAPFPDKDYGLRMRYEELEDYISETDRLKSLYKNRIRIYKGLEIEYHPYYTEYYTTLLKKFKLDYLALGEHTYTTNSGAFRNIFFAESTNDYADYAYAVSEAVATGFFSFVAHPDLMMLNEFAWDKNCDKACDLILCAAEKYDIPLEYNANGFRRGIKHYPDGVRYPYPDDRFWKLVSGSKIRVIVGSDCHTPEQIRDEAVIRAESKCAELGLNMIDSIF